MFQNQPTVRVQLRAPVGPHAVFDVQQELQDLPKPVQNQLGLSWVQTSETQREGLAAGSDGNAVWLCAGLTGFGLSRSSSEPLQLSGGAAESS